MSLFYSSLRETSVFGNLGLVGHPLLKSAHKLKKKDFRRQCQVQVPQLCPFLNEITGQSQH